MAVMYYAEGEHDAGFIGFRVATTISTDDYRQAYFSINEYSHQTAEFLANRLHDKWKAAMVKLENKTTKLRKNSGPHIISQGIRAEINVERKMRGELRTYFTPCFAVKVPGYGKSDLIFRTAKLGYVQAFEKAVEKYCDLHDLSDTQYVELLTRIPEVSIFTEYLLNITKQRHDITKEDILSKLNIENKDLE